MNNSISKFKFLSETKLILRKIQFAKSASSRSDLGNPIIVKEMESLI